MGMLCLLPLFLVTLARCMLHKIVVWVLMMSLKMCNMVTWNMGSAACLTCRKNCPRKGCNELSWLIPIL